MPLAQGLLKGPTVGQACVSHQQPSALGRLTSSRRSPTSRLALNARARHSASEHRAASAHVGRQQLRQQLRQHKKFCSCPASSVCGCHQTIVCSAGTAHPGEERSDQHAGGFSMNMSIPVTGMAKGLGSFQGATLEKKKLDLSREIKTQEPKVDNSGGGGNNGKNISNGGGGDGDDGDDDDYFDEFGDGDGSGDSDKFFRTVITQLYTKEAIEAVLQEWFRTVNDLPAIIRQSVMMGLFSSAQLVRFLGMDVRPNVTRAVTRTMPAGVSRGLVGRLMADPAFAYKMGLELAVTVGSSLAWEASQRKDRFTKELDLVAINTLSVAGATGALVWLLAPSRSYGAAYKLPWQNLLHSMPSNLFDASTPYRQFSLGKRAAGLFVKSAELCAVGSIAGAAMSGLSQAAVGLRRRSNPEFQPSVPVPTLSKSSAGMAIYMATSANLRYQAVSGVDRAMFDHCNVIWMYLGASSILRLCSNVVGEQSRRWLQGIPSGTYQPAPKPLPVAAPVVQQQTKPSAVQQNKPANKGKSKKGKSQKKQSASGEPAMSASYSS